MKKIKLKQYLIFSYNLFFLIIFIFIFVIYRRFINDGLSYFLYKKDQE